MVDRLHQAVIHTCQKLNTLERRACLALGTMTVMNTHVGALPKQSFDKEKQATNQPQLFQLFHFMVLRTCFQSP